MPFFVIYLLLFIFIYFTVPKVKLVVVSVTANSNTSVNVHWKIQEIHERLNNPVHFNLSYCPVEDCREYHSNRSQGKSKEIVGLITYAEYEFKVKAVGITAKDGTRVLYPEGNFSEPFRGRTKEGGKKRSVFLCRRHKVFLRPELFQTWLALTSVNHRGNV